MALILLQGRRPLHGHCPACFGAAPASFRTFLAMAHVRVCTTFRGTGFANFGAELAELIGIAAAQAHDFGGRTADGRTFQVELDATPELFYFFFLQAGSGTVAANHCTFVAGINTGLEFFV